MATYCLERHSYFRWHLPPFLTLYNQVIRCQHSILSDSLSILNLFTLIIITLLLMKKALKIEISKSKKN